ncbi:hypothetical protein KEM60_00708 [Austwickia sp. TVS 96-490-7B]|nr:hypothetical protein [Austwickia sp. TVS 96-490-7B]
MTKASVPRPLGYVVGSGYQGSRGFAPQHHEVCHGVLMVLLCVIMAGMSLCPYCCGAQFHNGAKPENVFRKRLHLQ